MKQGDLFEQGKRGESRHAQMLRKFAEFHTANRDVFNLFCSIVIRLIAEGATRVSPAGVFCEMREVLKSRHVKNGGEEIKLSNNHQPFYTRMFRLKYPEHAAAVFKYHCQFSKKKPANASDTDTINPEETMQDEGLNARLRALML